MSYNKQAEIEQIGGFLILITGCTLGVLLLESLRPGAFYQLSDWFKQQLQPFVSPNIELYSQDPDVESSRLLPEEFPLYDSMQLISQIDKTTNNDEINLNLANQANILVTNHIIASLQLLGITRDIGETISLYDLKKAYKQQLLLTHPDKAGSNSAAACREVMEAYKIIIKSQDDDNSTFNKLFKQEWMAWEQLKKQMDAYEDQVNAYCKKADAYCEKADAYCKGVATYCKEEKQISSRITQVLEDFKRLNKEQEEMDSANGLPPLTDEDIDGFKQDPDYFIKKRKAEIAKTQPMNESNVSDIPSDESVSNHMMFKF